MNSGTDFGFFTPYPNSKYGSPCSAFVVFLFINRFDYVNHVRPFRNIHYYTVLCRIVPRMLESFRGRWPVPIQNSDIAAPRPPTPISALVHSCPWQFPALVSFIPTKHTVQQPSNKGPEWVPCIHAHTRLQATSRPHLGGPKIALHGMSDPMPSDALFRPGFW